MTAKWGYERRDYSAGRLALVGVGFFVVLFSILGVLRFILGVFDTGSNVPALPRPLGAVEAEPVVQSAPQADLEDHLAESRSRLRAFEWVDRERGVLRIPIEMAMDILARQAEEGPADEQ